MNISEFKELLKVNKHDLDEEVVRQPSLYYEVGEAHALAIAERDYAKEELAHVDARLMTKHRKVLEDAEIRATESAINAGVIQDKEHIAAFEDYISKKEFADRLWALKDSFVQRQGSLEILAKLYLGNYYAKDTIKGEGTRTEFKTQGIREAMAAKRRTRLADTQ